MPFYEYECKGCSFLFEELQQVNDDPIKVCPKCKEEKVKRIISLTSKGQVDYKDARELYEEKIKPDAKRIAQKIRDGDENEAANFFGEDKLFGKK